jgi:hypothetical protein
MQLVPRTGTKEKLQPPPLIGTEENCRIHSVQEEEKIAAFAAYKN